jgi:hypothetical protein
MAIQVHSDGQPVVRSDGWPVWDAAGTSAPELLRWAHFLDHGDGFGVSHCRSVEALLEAAGNDRQTLVATRLLALRSLRQGIATQGVVDLVQDALDLAA